MEALGGYEFVEGATGDLSFAAWGPSPEAAFAGAADALLAATVDDPDRVEPRERRRVWLEEPDLELLLVRFLNELIYLRDAEDLLLRTERIEIVRDGSFRLRADLCGERIEPGRHALASDVKAATAHGLRVAEGPDGWHATVTVDV